MTTREKGEYGELKVLLRAREKGVTMSKPTIDCRYDFVLDDGEKLRRVQVKYADAKASNTDGAVMVNLLRFIKGSHQPYHSGEVDLLLVYVPRLDIVCAFEKDVWENRRSFLIRTEPPKNQQKTGCTIATNYQW